MKRKGQIILFLIPMFLLVAGSQLCRAQSYSSTIAPVTPSFSHTPGFYDLPIELSLFTSEDLGQIHFTLDGSEPSEVSPLFSKPILLKKTTVVKAITVTPQGVESSLQVSTFFIHENISPGLPVISLSTDSLILFDTISGLYTRGTKTRWDDPTFLQNYWKRDEFPMYFEYFDQAGKKVVGQAVGAKIFGNSSREAPQKSFRLTARKKYGKNRFEHNFFPNRDLFSFKQLVIRNSGTDWNNVHFRDAFVQNWADGHTFLDTQASQPCVAFLNGKYWGVYHLREYISKHMIASQHGLNPDFINLLESSTSPKEGSNEDFIALYDFVDEHDLSLAANFDSVKAELDLKNLTDYWAVEVWAANWDWMHHNVRFWCDVSSGSPWRYILWDMDMTMGSMDIDGQSHLQFNLNKNWASHVFILKKLLGNEQFKVYFINRNADLLNTLFAPEALLAELDAMVDLLSPEMHRHFETWGKGTLNERWGKEARGSYDGWLNGDINYIRGFLSKRQDIARREFQEEMGLKEQHLVYLDVFPSGAGKIQVNTVKITDFPWKGIYFDGIPVSLTALPNPGYTFDFWQNDGVGAVLKESQNLHVDLSQLDSLSAHFSGSPEIPVLTITEIKTHNNGLLDAGDWVELYNPGTVPFELSDWRLKDEKDKNVFVFPSETSLAPGAYLVVAQDTGAFLSVFPEIHSVVWAIFFWAE